MQHQIPFEAELIQRIGWLIRLRWWAILGTSLALALAWVIYPGQISVVPLLFVTALIGFYNVQFLLQARTLQQGHPGAVRARHATQLAYAQIILDLIALAALLHFSGGAENPMAVFFVFHTIIASILLSRRVSFVMATLAACLFGGVVSLEYLGWLAHHHLPVLGELELYEEGPYLLVLVGIMTLTLWLAAYMTGSISAKLRERDRALVKSSQAIVEKSHELERANQRLRRIDAERTRFMLLVTHELRAPISTIHTCVEVALAGYASPEKVRDILERIKRRTGELVELVGDLLRLARTREEASRDEVVGAIDPEKVLVSVVELMKTEAHSKDLFLSVDIEPGLRLVRANPERLKLLWTNLLSNAIKYSEPGGIVSVALKQVDGYLEATVRDTGIGIPEEDHERIFEEFYRADNARVASPVGTGVGLAIVQRIVENYGGRIWVESEQGLGSRFTFVLPSADS
jgi:signal transduction histidine kinase